MKTQVKEKVKFPLAAAYNCFSQDTNKKRKKWMRVKYVGKLLKFSAAKLASD